MREISRSDGTDLKDIEGDVKNKFRWDWLQEKDENDMFISDWARKVDIRGKVMCKLCNDLVKYGSGGKKDLKRHSKCKEHRRVIKLRETNQTLSSAFDAAQEVVCSLPYGAPENVHCEATCSSRRENVLPKIVSFQDRNAHAEAFIVSFLAENCLPFTMAPKLVQFAQIMSADAKVLQKLSMCRITASYKLREGLGALLSEDLVQDLKETFFSLNVDECFANNYEKMFSVLVSYYSEEQQSVVIKHYKSSSFAVVNAEKLSQFVLKSLSEDGIPLSNVVSVLSDSTNYMRGKHAGFETLMRKAIPHLLDVDGDSCHHAHNTAGAFCRQFGGVVESLCTDMRTEMTFSTDLRDYVNSLCEILGLNFRMPVNYTQHRWLSVLDAADLQTELLSAYTILYYGFIKNVEEKQMYREEIDPLMENASTVSKKEIIDIRKKCLNKKLTEAGAKCKERIVEKLFYKRTNTLLLLHLYTAVLPVIKSFVLILEQKEPMIHRLYDELKNCMRTFLGCFMRTEKIAHLTGKQMQEIDVKDRTLQKKVQEWNIGRSTRKILNNLKKDDPIRMGFETSS